MRFLLAILALLACDLALALVFPGRETDAGTALRLDLEGLVTRSERIVEARVLAAHTLETSGLLETEVLLEVARAFKGSGEPYRTLRLPGGVRTDGSGLVVPGVPVLVPGEEALLFLGAEGRDGVTLPTGLAQGKLALRRAADGTKELLRDVSSLGLVGPDALAPRERAGPARLDYAAVVAAIEAALGAELEAHDGGAGR